MSLSSRIETIKQFDLLDTICLVAAGEDLPEFYDEFVRCLMPDHEDRTPSFKVNREGFFKCFGCQARGDIIEFTKIYLCERTANAVDKLEAVLGIDKSIKGLVRRAGLDTPITQKHHEWVKCLQQIEERLIDSLVPYLRSSDWLVVSVCEGPLDYVLDEISESRAHQPTTARGQREDLRRLARFSRGMASYIEKEVERVSGKDVLDVAIQANN